MKIETTTVTQTGNEVLGTKEKSLYYLIVTNSESEKIVINVGEKTHNTVMELIKKDVTESDTIEKMWTAIKSLGYTEEEFNNFIKS